MNSIVCSSETGLLCARKCGKFVDWRIGSREQPNNKTLLHYLDLLAPSVCLPLYLCVKARRSRVTTR